MGVIEQIYEAAVIPERWEDALRGMACLSDADNASLLVFHDAAAPQMVGYNVPPLVMDRYADGLWENSVATRWGLSARPSDFSSFRDNIDEAQLLADPAVKMLYDMGVTDTVITVHPMPSGHLLGLKLDTRSPAARFDPDRVRRLNALRPHLLRSGQIAAQLGLERVRTMVETMAHLGLAAGVIDHQACVIATNPLFDAMETMFVPCAFGKVAINDKRANEALRAALAMRHDEAGSASISIPVAATPETCPLLVHLVPICGDARDVFSGGRFLMVVARIEPRAAPRPDLLNGLFDLTRAEARLVGELVAGGSLPGVATRLGLSVHTVRAQLRSVAAKTGVSRQAELMQLLAAI